jgi:catechol 2,3-dioxygenase-like lactoylglutathione lyase family enzyme
MHLGAFSISLNVKDIAKSASFYEALGFVRFHDMADQGWMILRQGDTVLGLYSGHVEQNTLTFNPGWDQAAQPIGDFTDVRDIQKALKAKGITLDTECDESTSGPAHVVLRDPDGNPVLIDQHV